MALPTRSLQNFPTTKRGHTAPPSASFSHFNVELELGLLDSLAGDRNVGDLMEWRMVLFCVLEELGIKVERCKRAADHPELPLSSRQTYSM